MANKKHRRSNIEWWKANEERKRSNVARPHRNKSKYRRADWRNERQSGKVEA